MWCGTVDENRRKYSHRYGIIETEVDVGVVGLRLPDNTNQSFTCYGVNGVFVLSQYFLEKEVVDILAARIEGWIDVEPLVDSHCVNFVEWSLSDEMLQERNLHSIVVCEDAEWLVRPNGHLRDLRSQGLRVPRTKTPRHQGQKY